MKELIQTFNDEMQAVAADASATFGAMTGEQLNWKPAADSWSIAQCFDHLIVTHGLYFPIFERLAAGEAKMTFWEKFSPFSGFFGRFLIKGLDPKNKKKIKTTGRAQPASSEIAPDIIERFSSHQKEIIDAVAKLPQEIDASRQMVTSPLMGLITYSLADTFTFMPLHCRRHFEQARRVAETPGFPA